MLATFQVTDRSCWARWNRRCIATARRPEWHATCLSALSTTVTDSAPHPFSRVLARNIDALLESRRAEERRKGTQDRISDAITRFTGSLRFVYIHAAVFGFWIVWNLG